MALPDATEQITQALSDPASISGDGITVQSRTIDEQIKGLQFGAMLETLNKRRRGIRYTQMLPQGPVNNCGQGTDTNFNRGCC